MKFSGGVRCVTGNSYLDSGGEKEKNLIAVP